ncbi:MAG: prepilin peptidase [Alphaproteobacteria bacterium]|nr:prepilin peptidase [Alphaproteobacteria bacterium]
MFLALTAFHVAIVFIAATVFVAAAVSDAHSYRIPNSMCGLLLLMYPVFVVSAPHTVLWRQSLAVFGLVSIVGFAAFLGKFVGAGDVKLLAVSSLWAGPHLVAVFLVVTAFAGGVLSIVMALAAQLRLRKAGSRKVEWTKVQIPYGIAIATGGLVTLGLIAKPILLPG